ncbi:MAG: RNA-splicing ligase RtcB [Omnitrophica bacterium RIFOXYB12_FULL_50_7]|nr:MAG: RNA-splicing ligase RtcB [Omnitrophica bacterium RIFOXYB12_FULL_50_7]
MRVCHTEKIPIKMWLEDIEEGAMSQLKNLANLPFAFKHIAVMPDSHQGYGMPIGGVLATKGMIIPNAVGVDIGCGMCAMRSSLESLDRETLKKILGEIKAAVPVGFNHHKTRQEDAHMPGKPFEKGVVCEREYRHAIFQVGTLGGGNHFIEIQKGSDGFIWVMVHSGSRNLGKQVADHYNRMAIRLNEEWNSPVPKSYELAFLPENSDEGKAYIREMNYCVEFAFRSRKLMTERIAECFLRNTRGTFEPIINIAHNYARKENHFGQDVWVHRKGATSAREGEVGIIPGSQGTQSYIVKGKGNPESFQSCSHGAGRKMGRKQAQRSLNLQEEIRKMDAQGILHGIRGVHELDEAPGAYKDINEVMKQQSDLVDIWVELSPLGVVKG